MDRDELDALIKEADEITRILATARYKAGKGLSE